MSRYRFALKPRWIASHLFVLLLVVTMISAMFWQISRLHQKQARNAKVAARSHEPTAPITSLTKPGAYDGAGALEFRRVTATGTYQADQQVLVRSRSRDGAPGSWVLTPLVLADGQAVTINRGWIANGGEFLRVPARFAPATGTVTVTGLARPSETRGSFGSRDPKTGTLTNLARADIKRLDQQVPEDLLPVFIQLETQKPGLTDQDPEPVPMPALDEGPHLSYAIQWAIFTTIALVGYPLILRRRAREIEKESKRKVGPDPDPEAADESQPGPVAEPEPAR